jgi:uncharacterized membrane protein
MSILFIVVAVIAIVLIFTGGFVSAVNFLLWVGIVLLILAVIAFLIRTSLNRGGPVGLGLRSKCEHRRGGAPTGSMCLLLGVLLWRTGF